MTMGGTGRSTKSNNVSITIISIAMAVAVFIFMFAKKLDGGDVQKQNVRDDAMFVCFIYI